MQSSQGARTQKHACPFDAFEEPLTPSLAGIEQLASVWLPLSENEPTAESVPFSFIPGFQYLRSRAR